MIENKVTIVVSSCDTYEDLWNPFFQILKEEWPGIEEYRIVLNTESKSFSFGDLKIRSFQLYHEGTRVSWTRRLRKTLEKIDTEYVLTLLDDFYMLDRVESGKICEHVRWMENNRRITSFCYMETDSVANIDDRKYDGFVRRPWISPYKLNCQAALWRRKRLIEYLRIDENPWEWETYGNWRTYRHPFQLFYAHKPGEKYVFPYIFNVNDFSYGGLAIYRGRWYLPYVQPLFEKYGINVEFSKRGVVDDDEFELPNQLLKRKEDASRWKQMIWFIRPLYCSVKRIIAKTKYVLKNIRHFF